MVLAKKRTAWRQTLQVKIKVDKRRQLDRKNQLALDRLNRKKQISLDRLKRYNQLKKQRGRLIGARLTRGRIAAKVKRGVQSKSAAVLRSHRTKTFAIVYPQTGRVNRMPSSWIKSFAYDQINQKMFMTVKTGRTYTWDNIDPNTASHVIKGDASCITNDKERRKRWWVSKTPSLGAAYWHYLSGNRVI